MGENTEGKIRVHSVNVSVEKGTIKKPVPEIVINDLGIEGDAHSGPWHRQVSILAQERIREFEDQAGRKMEPGEFAENITSEGLDLQKVALLDRFRIGSVDLEVTQIGKECHGDACAIYREVGRCIMPKEGLFCRVMKGGTVKAGDSISFLPRMLKFRIVTVSDRASRGEYEDRSGPRIRELLCGFFSDKRWHVEVESAVVSDDARRIRDELTAAHDDGVDVIITTGGTGVGPRDVTPDVVASLADKAIPGIMEHIRAKFGNEKPNALLSRGIAAVWGRGLIYTLPGSVRAVGEYMGEVLKTLEHTVLMLHELDVH